MEYSDIVFCALVAAAMASLAGLGLIKTHPEDGKVRFEWDTADVDQITLTAIVTYVSMFVARHPEWTS